MTDTSAPDDPVAASDEDAATIGADYEALLAEAEQVLDDVDHALARLDDGTYGTCELCGGPIDPGRLAGHPAARSCERHPQLTDPATGPA